MYPEAGGSSSFARRAFNEFWSSLTAWGQMLNYIITVAISAYFLPHYLGIVWEPLMSSPADVIVAVGVVAFLAIINIVGVKEAAGLNVFLAAERVGVVTHAVVVVDSSPGRVESHDDFMVFKAHEEPFRS